MSKLALAIGGPKDREMLAFDAPEITVIDRNLLPLGISPVQETIVSWYRYRVEVFHTSKRNFYFAVPFGMEPDSIMNALIDAYKKPA